MILSSTQSEKDPIKCYWRHDQKEYPFVVYFGERNYVMLTEKEMNSLSFQIESTLFIHDKEQSLNELPEV